MLERVLCDHNNDDSQSGQSNEDDLIKAIANGFSTVEETGAPIGKSLANIINNCSTQYVEKNWFEN